MGYAKSWQALRLLPVILLAACKTLEPVPVVAPCPEQPHPPASLKHRAESPQTEQRLIELTKTTTPPAPATQPR